MAGSLREIGGKDVIFRGSQRGIIASGAGGETLSARGISGDHGDVRLGLHLCLRTLEFEISHRKYQCRKKMLYIIAKNI